jgi:trehalose synthase
MIKFYKKAQPWVWRCHVDFSQPDKTLWDFLSSFILRYDVMLLSHESYKKKDLPVEQRIIVPAIDPITPKNMDITEEETCKYLRKFGVKTDKPFLLQVSRFDKWKDPEGVIKVWSRVKEEVDCRLVLCGNIATDDPEGGTLFQAVEKSVKQYSTNDDITLLLLENNYLVNALQRMAAVVIQKSIKEGFCLSVTEAMWKGTPVVASRVGGIPLQIEDGVNGFLLEPDDTEGFADKIIKILKDKEMGKELGKKGKEIVRKKFLITRLLSDYLDLLTHLWM